MLPKNKLPDLSILEDDSKNTSKGTKKKKYERSEFLPNGKKRLPRVEYDENGRPINPIPNFDTKNIRAEFYKYL